MKIYWRKIFDENKKINFIFFFRKKFSKKGKTFSLNFWNCLKDFSFLTFSICFSCHVGRVIFISYGFSSTNTFFKSFVSLLLLKNRLINLQKFPRQVLLNSWDWVYTFLWVKWTRLNWKQEQIVNRISTKNQSIFFANKTSTIRPKISERRLKTSKLRLVKPFKFSHSAFSNSTKTISLNNFQAVN